MDGSDIDDLRPDPAAVALVPEAVARTLRCVALSASPRTLRIAVAIPLSGEQIRSLTSITRRQMLAEIEPGAHVVDDLIDAAYGPPDGTAGDAA